MKNNGNSVAFAPPILGGLTLLEHLHANGVKQCEKIHKNSPMLLGINRAEKNAFSIQVNCKQWDCMACGANNARKWVARVIEGVKFYGGQWFFMTLTAHRWKRGAIKSLENLRQGWKKLYNRLRRKYGNFHYIKVYEHHADKSLHMHILTDLKLPYKTIKKEHKNTGLVQEHYSCRALKNLCVDVGIGYMADYQPLENAGLSAWYVTKYLTKSIGVTDFPVGLRRIQTNHGFPKLLALGGGNDLQWAYVSDRLTMLHKTYNLWKFEDIVTYDKSTDSDITTDDWEKFLF